MTNISQNKNNKVGGFVKKLFFSLLGIFLLLGGVTLSACSNEQKASISVSSASFVQTSDGYGLNISLNKEDENFAIVTAKVKNASDGRIKVSNNFENLIEVTTDYNAKKDESTIVVKGVNEGYATVILNSWSGNADPVKFNVYVYSDIIGLNQKVDQGVKNTQYIEKETPLKLEKDRFLDFVSRPNGESNRKEVTWEFSNPDGEYIENYEEGVTYLYKFIDGELMQVASISDDGYLTVFDCYDQTKISLVAKSFYTEHQALVELSVLDKFTKDDTSMLFGRTSDAFDDLDSISSQGKITIVRNDDSANEAVFFVKLNVQSKYDLEITPYVSINADGSGENGDYLIVTSERQTVVSGNDHEYIFKVKGVNNQNLEPRSVFVAFDCGIKNFDKVVRTDFVEVAITDVVDQIVVNTTEGQVYSGDEFEIYDRYVDNDGRGKLFNIQLKPETVLEGLDTFKIWLTPSADLNVTDMGDYISIVYEDGLGSFREVEKFERIAGSDTFEAYFSERERAIFADNSEIFVRANNEFCIKDGKITLSFISTQTETVRADFELSAAKAPVHGSFVITDPATQGDYTKHLPTNEFNEVSYQIGVMGVTNANGLYLDYETNLPISVSALEYANNVLFFSVRNTEKDFSGNVTFTLKHKNGDVAQSNEEIVLSAFKPLISATVTLDNVNSYGVSQYNYEEDSLSNIAMVIGAVAKLNYNINGESRVEIDEETANFVKNGVLTAGLSEINQKQLTIKFVGRDANGEETTIERNFNLEVYVPVSSLNTNASILNLIAKDSLSSEDENLSIKRITVNLRNDSNLATYRDLDNFVVSSATSGQHFSLAQAAESVVFDAENLSYTIRNANVENNVLSFVVEANSTNGYSSFRDTLNLSYTKFSSNISTSLTLNVKNAVRIQNIVWENEQDSIYLNPNSTDLKERSFVIVTTKQPQNAYNTELTYVFVADNGTQSNIISIDKAGVVRLNTTGIGGTGYIYVLPSDSIKLVGGVKNIVYLDMTNNYRPTSVPLSSIAQNYETIITNGYLLAGLPSDSENYVSYNQTFKKIRLIVADGESEETALRIYSKEQLAQINPTKHYILMSDINLSSDWTPIQNLSGSIGGYVSENEKINETKGSRSNIQISLDNTVSLVENVLAGGKIKDLNLTGIAADAFVARENNGTIQNITINAVVGNTITPSKVLKSDSVSEGKFGIVVDDNKGTIKDTAVLGASINVDAIENEVYVGAIAGENSGLIQKSYFEIYRNNTGANEINTGIGYAGGLVGYLNGGTIEESYVYDYTLEVDLTVTHIIGNITGALVGKAGNDSTIKNSFAVTNIKDVIGEDVLVEELSTTTIEDIYNSYNQETEEGSGIYEYKSDITFNRSDYWTIGEGIVAYVNGGYEHLKFYQELKESLPNNIQSITGKSLTISENKGVLMLNDITISKTNLTISQRNALTRTNTIAIKDLFEDGQNKVLVTSSEPSIVETTSTSIIIKSKGRTTLRVYSSKDFSEIKEFEIVVISTISDFRSDLDNNSISVQKGFTGSIEYSIKDQIYLGSDSYELVCDRYSLEATIESVSTGVDTGYITLNSNDLNVSVEVSEVSEDGVDKYSITAKLKVSGLDGQYASAVAEKFTKVSSLTAFKGARYIGISSEEITIYPSMVSNLKVELETDDDSDSINLQIKNNLGNVLTSTLFNDEYVFTDAGIEKIKIKQTKEPIATNYILTISVVDDYRSQILEQERYTLYITSKSGTATNENTEIVLTLKPQLVNHVDMTNYLYETMSISYGQNDGNGTLVYKRKNQISSVITPGSSSFMVIGIDPTYANYEYMTVGAVSESGKSLVLTKLVSYNNSLVEYKVDTTTSIVYQGYNLKVTPKEHEEQYIFRVYVPTSIKENVIIPFVMSLYDKNGKLLNTKTYDLAISYQKPAEIIVNDNESSIIAKDGTAKIRVNVGKDQTLDNLSLMSARNGISINNFAGPFEEENGKYYTADLYAGFNAEVNTYSGIGNFQIKAQISRVINGILEVTETRYEMTLVDIALKKSEKNIVARIGITDEFDLNYIFDPENYSNINSAQNLISKREAFKADGYYVNPNDDFAINPGPNGQGVPITERLYVVNGLNVSKVTFRDNIADLRSFELIYNPNPAEGESALRIKGKATTATDIRLRLDNYIYTNKNASSYNTISNFYNIRVETYTDEELPDVIRTAEDFLKIQDNETPQNYILLNDIELVNYKPFDTTMIASLDGNGYTINITSFDTDGKGTLGLALFRNVTDITTLKNIRVNYYLGGDLDVDVSSTNGYSVVQIAGFALNNNGTITNCHVMSDQYQSNSRSKSSQISGINVKLTKFGEEFILKSDSQVEIAGFVLSNMGVITNSTVGGKSYVKINETETATANATTVSLRKFSIIGQGTVSGFVQTNSGVIASSDVDQIEIINKSSNINFKTSGFALSNSGRISTSFIQGVYNSTVQGGSDETKCLNGSVISSKGYIAGFINSNSGTINDSYSNILIQGPESESTSYFATGFVYVNTGAITTSYSGCKLAVANSSQTNFSGVDINMHSLNTGNIVNCYYNGEGISYVSPEDTEKLISSGAMIARNPSSQTQFYGFTFASDLNANDGIWFISNKILTLVAPNQMAVSRRVYQEVGESYVLPYAQIILDSSSSNAKEYLYGGTKNPIIIRDAQEFASAMGGADASTNIGKHCQNGHITGSYRLVSDIKLSELNSIEGVAVIESTKSTFNGTLDGNGFEINNISLSGSETDYSVGLFSQIYKGTVINLDLEFLSVTATTSGFVGGLSGFVYESNLININARQTLPGDTTSTREFGIKGANVVGGIIGAIFGENKIANIVMDDPIVQATYYDEDHADENGKNFYLDQTTDPSVIRKYFETLKNSNSTEITKESLKNLCKNSEKQYLSVVSYAGGLFGYLDNYTSLEIEQSVFDGKVINDQNYKIYKLRVNNTANIRAEVAGGLVGFVGINTNIKDAGIILSKADITSNILSYNNFAAGVVGYNSGTLKQIFAEYDEDLQIEIENNLSNYYNGTTSAERGLLDVYENTLSFDEKVTYEYEPLYIGGLVGYARTGRIISSYNKINVITTVDNCVAGGIVGVVGTPKDGERFSEQAGEGEFVTSSLTLNEVYASSDVLGGSHTVDEKIRYITGGIVGEIKSGATVTLSAVNAVNYFGTLNETVYNNINITGNNISEVGVYSLVGKYDNLAENIKTLTPVTDNSSMSGKHVGYVASYKLAQNINKDIEPYANYSPSDDDAYFKINSLSNINSGESGYIEMNGAFVGSGNWVQDNWEHKIDRVYPAIQLMIVNDYYWWDQDNTLEILKLMKNSSKEIRVRGRNAFGDIEPIVIDLSNEIYSKYFPIKDFDGKLVAGWTASGDRDESKIEYQKIIFKNTDSTKRKSIFQNFGSNTNISDIYIQIGGDGDSTENTVNGAYFVQSNIVGATLSNVVFDIQKNITIDTVNGKAGFITTNAQDTNFDKVKFIIASDKQITFNQSGSDDVYLGLLAGKIEQKSKYSQLTISNIEVDYIASSTQIVRASLDINEKDVFIGMIAGKVEKHLASADMNIFGITFKNNGNDGFAILEVNNSGSVISNLYLGGYFGKIIGLKSTVTNNVATISEDAVGVNTLNLDAEAGVNIKVSAPKFNKGYIGGIIGYANSNTLSMVVDGEIQTEVLYSNECKFANIGGLFGEVRTGKFDIEANYLDLKVGNSNQLKENANIGGLAGNAQANGNCNLDVSIKLKGSKDSYNIKSAINITSAGLETANIGGLFGDEGANSLTLDGTSTISANINIGGSDSVATLNSGLISGNKSNGGNNYKIENRASGGSIEIDGSIICASPITTKANVGGLIGKGEKVNIKKVTLNITIGKTNDPITASKSTINASYINNGINAQTANIGGYIGQSTNSLTVNGGEITESSKIAVKSSNTTNVGGIVGLTTGNLTITSETDTRFKNRGLFAVENTTNNETETDIGGLVGQIPSNSEQIQSNSEQIQIGTADSTSTSSNQAQVFVDANFFVNANKTNLGGMIGKIASMSNGSYINDTIFGGAFKSVGVDGGTHYFGGIVGKTESGVSGKLCNNSSFGDDIVTYSGTNRFNSYKFGGIIGDNQGLTLNTNYSLTTCNNDRIAGYKNSNDVWVFSDTRGAIVGNHGSGTYTDNLYSHVVNLATDYEGLNNKGRDVGYITSYDVNRGYNGGATSTALATLVKNKVTEYISTYSFGLGSKLNPIELNSNQPQTDAADTNGVSYFTFTSDGTIASQINVSGYNVAKRAIIGNARVLKYTNTSGAFINSSNSKPLQQNEIISGMNLDINEEYDVTTCGDHGGLVNAMTGGTIYAVAISGKLSVGGNKHFNLAPITSINGGLIDECNSSVDVIYRGSGADDDGHPQVSGFVAMYSTNSNNAGGINSIDIRNCYSTGQVSTYIDAQAFAFTDGHHQNFEEYEYIRVTNCYTISQIDQNDYTSANNLSEPTGVFGCNDEWSKMKLKDCWYDVNGTECATTSGGTQKTTDNVSYSYNETGNPSKTGFATSTGWDQSKDYNFGYATRNFGYLKQSSYVKIGTTYQENGTTIASSDYKGITTTSYTRLAWNEIDTTQYFLVPNAGKLNQVKSVLSGKYVQMYDFNLVAANLKSTNISGTFSGTYDGQEKTIQGGTTSLFATISGTVKNLRITDVNIRSLATSGEIKLGALAQTSSGVINNIVVSGFVSGQSKQPASENSRPNTYHLGGLVGSTTDGQVLNCKNYVKIDFNANPLLNANPLPDVQGQGDADVGGIVGNAGSTEINNCINYAPIQNNAAGFGGAGGIAGYINGGLVTNSGNTNSVLAGYILTIDKNDGYSAGGIVGNMHTGTITNCYNTAMVKAGNKSSTLASYAGGIVGYAAGEGTFTNLYNSGVIEALGKDFKDIQNGYTISATSSQVKINISSSENVYAEGIIGNNKSATNYKNDGQVIRNGIYKKGETTYTYSWDTNTKRSIFSDYAISTEDYEAHITGYDDLGYPTSFCVTAKRTISLNKGDFWHNGANSSYKKETHYLCVNQTIISKTYSLSSTYYEESKSKGEKNGSVNASTLINKADSSTNTPISITISGNEYQIATDKNSFNKASSGQYQTYTKEIDLKQIFGSSKFTDLYTLDYSFSVNSISSNKASIEVLPATCTITDVKENGKANLTIGYSCSSTETVSGIRFNYTITASREDLSYSVNVSKNNIFEVQSGGNWIYTLHIAGDTATYEGNTVETCDYMIDGNEYVVNIGGVEYRGVFSYADKTLTIVNSTRISLSNNTTISYMFVQNEESLHYETEFTSESTQTTYNKEKTYSQTKEYVYSQTDGEAGYLLEGWIFNLWSGDHTSLQDNSLLEDDPNYDYYMHITGNYDYPIGGVSIFNNHNSQYSWLHCVYSLSDSSLNTNHIIKALDVTMDPHEEPIACEYSHKFRIIIDYTKGEQTVDYKIYHYSSPTAWEGGNALEILRIPVNILYQHTETNPDFNATENEGNATYQKDTTSAVSTTTIQNTQTAVLYGGDVYMNGQKGTRIIQYSQKYTLSQISVSQNKTKASGNEVKQYEISDGTKVEKYVDDSLSNSHVLATSFNNTYSNPANNVTITYTTKTMSRNLPKDTGLSTSSLANNSQFIITSDITNGLRLENGSTSITGTNGTITVGSKTYTYTVLLDGYKLVNNNIAYYSTYDSNNDVYKITLDGVEYTLYTTAFEYTEYVVKNGETVTIDGVKYPSDSGISGYTREVIDDYTYFHNGSEVVYKVDTSGDNVVIRRNGTTTNYEYETFGVNVINLKGSSKTKTYTTAAQSNYDNYFVNQSAQTIYIVSEITNDTNDYSSYINTVIIDGVDQSGYKHTYNIVHLSDDQEHTVEVGFKPSTSSSQSITGVEFKPNTAQGVIVKADINQGSALSTTIDKNISGNGYFINYYSNNSMYVENLKGAFIKDLNFGGTVITKNTSVVLGVYTIENVTTQNNNGEQETKYAKLCNVNTYGAISDISTSFQKHYFVSSSSNDNISNVSNYANYSAFNDEYAGADIGVKFVKESKNYGVIVGFDGKNGVKGNQGSTGQSFEFTTLINNGIIKAGNGGNGGRGVDGTIGADSTSDSLTPTQGTEGAAGGTAGAAGTVSVKSGGNGKEVQGSDGQKGFNGNTGHGGYWLSGLYESPKNCDAKKHNSDYDKNYYWTTIGPADSTFPVHGINITIHLDTANGYPNTQWGGTTLTIGGRTHDSPHYSRVIPWQSGVVDNKLATYVINTARGGHGAGITKTGHYKLYAYLITPEANKTNASVGTRA